MSLSRTAIREVLKRLLGSRLGKTTGKEELPREAILNKDYEKLQHFQIWMNICGTEKLEIAKKGMSAIQNIGRNKALAESDIITQLAAFLAPGIKEPGFGIGQEEGLFDDTE